MPIQENVAMLRTVEFWLIDLLLLAGIVWLLRSRKKVFAPAGDVLDRAKAEKIKGLLAMLVILHHLSISTSCGVLFKGFVVVGIICVALFFFYSGYGLMVNYLRKPEYLKNFFSRRILRILVPYGLALTAAWCGALMNRYWCTLGEIWDSLLRGDPIVRYSWYVLTIAVLYLVFWISALLLHRPGWILVGILTGTVGYYTLVTSQASWGHWTVNSCFVFLLGAGVGAYREQLSWLLRPSRRSALAAAALLVPGALLMASALWAAWGHWADLDALSYYFLVQPVPVLGMNLICAGGVILCLWGLARVRLPQVFSFLGQISFELYLVHGLMMYLLRSKFIYCATDFLYACGVLGLSVLAAWGMHWTGQRLYGAILQAPAAAQSVLAVRRG